MLKNSLIIYGYNNKNLGDDLMFSEIINKTNYDRYFFIGENIVPAFLKKHVDFIRPGRLFKFRWKIKADFAIIGGSVLMGATDTHKAMLEKKLDLLKWNKLLGGRNFIVGANLGPYRAKDEYMRYLTEIDNVVDKWLVRDDFSKALLDELPTERSYLLPDIVMGFEDTSCTLDNSIAISVTQVAKDSATLVKEELYIDEITQIITHFVNKERLVRLVSFEDSVDLSVIESVLANLDERVAGKVEVCRNEDSNVINAIKRAEYVVSTRFHCMILAALFEKKQLIYSYSEKTSNFALKYGFNVQNVSGNFGDKPFQPTMFSSSEKQATKRYVELLERV